MGVYIIVHEHGVDPFIFDSSFHPSSEFLNEVPNRGSILEFDSGWLILQLVEQLGGDHSVVCSRVSDTWLPVLMVIYTSFSIGIDCSPWFSPSLCPRST